MKWNDPKINDAVKNGLKEFSACNRNSLKFDKLHEQLKYVIEKQESENVGVLK